MSEVFTINLEALIEKKFPGRKFPGWLISGIKRFIHLDVINDYLSKGYTGTDFATKSLDYFGVEFEITGAENIPADGRFTFASNHPLGGFDAMGFISYLGQKYDGRIIIPANDFLMALKPLEDLLIPVNKTGSQSRTLSKALDDAFASDRQILIFPAGLCSRKIGGVIRDLPWKKTFITKSRESERDIIPVWISGRNSDRFYFVDRLARFFKMKVNPAMFFLPDEMYRGRGKKYQIVIGSPIPWQTFTGDRKDSQWAEYVYDTVYRLKL